MKKVIFIGGTAYSGTTFFQMILANDPGGFAVGEAHDFFRPTKDYHYDMMCSCGDKDCSVWAMARVAGENSFYKSLFDANPEIDFIIDTSKHPSWIKEQSALLAEQGIAVYNVLMWKSPEELAKSFQKRGDLNAWERSWVSYHRHYFTSIDTWASIKYREFVMNRSALAAVCEYLDIPDFRGKEQYWNKTHHAFAGNPSARVHLYEDGSQKYRDDAEHSNSPIDATEKGIHKTIYYDSELEEQAKQHVAERIERNPNIPRIMQVLQATDLIHPSGEKPDTAPLIMPGYRLQVRKMKHLLKRTVATMRYQS